MNRGHVEQRAEELFAEGLHCAEAVLVAVLEGQGLAGQSPRAASAFGGGVGRSKKSLCGALSGGLIALGVLQGRNTADERWDAVAAAAESVRARFEAEQGCTTCGQVLEKLGPQQGMDRCIRLAGRTAGLFHQALAGQLQAEPVACGCTAREGVRQAAKTADCGCGCG